MTPGAARCLQHPVQLEGVGVAATQQCDARVWSVCHGCPGACPGGHSGQKWPEAACKCPRALPSPQVLKILGLWQA